ncbi:hypothetical protein QOZ77_32770, partial [Pseudomonas aeruginosa]|uniref:hypothetical protein n=1 Tax=Pseudomonas aeruginosa TaxID=287 RepID=UPI00345B0C4E
YANLNPKYKLQMSPLFAADPWSGSVPNTFDPITQSYPGSYYLQNSSGQYYDDTFKSYGPYSTGSKMGRPSITRAQS